MRPGNFLLASRPSRPAVVGGAGAWSNPATWGGVKPVAGDPVVIGTGSDITLDEDTPSLGVITISSGGTLRVKQGARVWLTCASVVISGGGAFLCGTEAAPFAGNFRVTLTGAESGRAARLVADYLNGSGGVARSGAGDAALKQLTTVSGAVAETITVTFSSATAFSVSGSVSGSLGSGTVGTWFSNCIEFLATAGATPQDAGSTITVTVAQRGFANDGTGRTITVNPGGRWEFVGTPPATPWTRLADHYTANGLSAALRAHLGWAAGDRIVISGTDWIDNVRGASARTHVKSVAAGVAQLTGGFAGDRWGKVQYITDSGWSLTPGTITRPSDPADVASYIPQADWDEIPKTLDQAAVAINLTRNIVVEGAEDDAWVSSRFGVHTMVMGLSSIVRLNGVEFRRVGQAGAIGRYPFHWHMLSYGGQNGGNMGKPSDGTFLGDANPANHYLKNCAIYDSGQRGTVIHGTCGVLVQRNVYHNITGHCVFLEDAAEERNTIEYNVVLGVSPPTSGNKLIDSDQTGGLFSGGSTGFWLSNLNNIIRYNICIGAETPIWDVSGAQVCHGLCREVAIVPNQRPTIEFHHCESAVGRSMGFLRTSVPTNHFHALTEGIKYQTNNWAITDNVSWKNLLGAYKNRLSRVILDESHGYKRWTASDNASLNFSGATDSGVPFERALVAGTSLNNADNRYVSGKVRGFSTYDQGFEVRNSLFAEYPTVLNSTSDGGTWGNIVPGVQQFGMIAQGEYLPSIVEFRHYYGFKTVNVGPTKGGLILPYQISPVTDHFGSLGVIRDVNGLFGAPGRHIVFDHPYYTAGAADLQDYPGGKSTSTRYLAIGLTYLSGIASGTMFTVKTPVTYDRLDPTNGNILGSWVVPDGTLSGNGLNHFRGAGVPLNGMVRLSFGGVYPDNIANISVVYARDTTDLFTVGIPWPNAQSISKVSLSRSLSSSPGSIDFSNNWARLYDNTGMTSAADVHADTTGTKYWKDTTNNLVWIRYKGGLVPDNSSPVPFTNESKAWYIWIEK